MAIRASGRDKGRINRPDTRLHPTSRQNIKSSLATRGPSTQDISSPAQRTTANGYGGSLAVIPQGALRASAHALDRRQPFSGDFVNPVAEGCHVLCLFGRYEEASVLFSRSHSPTEQLKLHSDATGNSSAAPHGTKGFPTFGPIGPWLVIADEIGSPQTLSLWLEVNGRRIQNGNTATMIFTVAEIVAYCSEFTRLEPGDIITTGKPPGVGLGQKPNPWYLKPGDNLRLGIEGLGEQQQQCVAHD